MASTYTTTTLPDTGAVPRRVVRVSTPAGETSLWVFTQGKDCVVVGSPGGGGTVKAQATWSPVATVQADNDASSSNSIAVDWDYGTSSSARSQFVRQPTAIRFVAETKTSTGEISQ